MREPNTYEPQPANEPRPGNKKRLIVILIVLALAATALVVGLRVFDSSGCCQCDNQCQDVSRASECQNICRNGVYMKGKTCNANNKCV